MRLVSNRFGLHAWGETSPDIRKLERAEDGALTRSPAVSTFFILTKQHQIQAILSTISQLITNMKTLL